MNKPKYCPLMTIGFSPPKKGEEDLRLCKEDCAWYNLSEENCNINVLTEYAEYIMAAVESPGGSYDDYGTYEDPWTDRGGFSKSP